MFYHRDRHRLLLTHMDPKALLRLSCAVMATLLVSANPLYYTRETDTDSPDQSGPTTDTLSNVEVTSPRNTSETAPTTLTNVSLHLTGISERPRQNDPERNKAQTTRSPEERLLCEYSINTFKCISARFWFVFASPVCCLNHSSRSCYRWRYDRAVLSQWWAVFLLAAFEDCILQMSFAIPPSEMRPICAASR